MSSSPRCLALVLRYAFVLTLPAAALCSGQTPSSTQPAPAPKSRLEQEARLQASLEGLGRRFASAAHAGADLSPSPDPWTRRGAESLWRRIHGTLADWETPRAEITLLDIVDEAIDRYMAELGRIAWEMEDPARTPTPEALSSLHPGSLGSGSISLGHVGEFRDLSVTFRGKIAHPDGEAPAVVAKFYLVPPSGRPVVGRLLVPMAGVRPSFRASAEKDGGARDYGWRPRLMRTRSILELRDRGGWRRIHNEIDDLYRPPRRLRVEDTFCDASCGP